MKTDCLIIGYNDSNFEDYVQMVHSMGTDSGAYRDLHTSFIEFNNKPYRSMDILNHFYFQQKKVSYKPFHNADFLWPVITYLGTFISRKGFQFDYVNLFQQEKEKLREKLKTDDILTVAITTTLYVAPHPILEIISFIRKYNKKTKIIVGGPYIFNLTTMDDSEALKRQFKYLGADFYVINQEGEQALANILKALKNDSRMAEIENIAYRQGDGYIVAPLSIEVNSLEENMVDYSLFPKEDLGELISLRTAKSCPFACAFCGFSQRAGQYRYLSVDLVEKELDAIRDIGTATTLTFIDDSFNVPKKRFKEILKMMIRNNYGFRWNSFFRCDYGDEEIISLMKDAGCEGVVLGVESVNNDMLERMNKTSRREDYLEAIPLLKKAGIVTYAGLIIGFPGETHETALEAIAFIETTKPDFFRAQLWYCDPLTPIWNQREEYDIQGSAFNWSHNTMDSKTAIELIERIFFSVENSIWLPQYGFELWSVFYLQRRGLTRDQVKTFLKCFNTVVKEKILFPGRKKISNDLLESLRQSCLFHSESTPEMDVIKAFSGSSYVAAEKFWASEVGNRLSRFCLEPLRDKVDSCENTSETIPLFFDKEIVNNEKWDDEVGLHQVILSAYSVLLSRLAGQEEVVIVSAIMSNGWGERILPLMLFPTWGLSFREFVLNTKAKMQQLENHAQYSFHFLGNSRWMEEHDIPVPVFSTGYIYYSDPQEKGEKNGLERLHEFDPPTCREIALVLEVVQENNHTKTMQFSYSHNFFKQETVEKFAACLTSIFEELGRNPDVLIGEIDVGTKEVNSSLNVESDAEEAFNF